MEEEEEQDVVDYEDDFEEVEDEDEEGDLAAGNCEEVEVIHSDSSSGNDDDLEPDSLAEGKVRREDSSDSDTVQISREEEDDNDEIEEVFSRDANSNTVSRTAVGCTRADSIMSRSSISYFVDLQERDASSPKGSPPLESPATAVMSQSMHVSGSEGSRGSLAFFVDISKNERNARPQPQPKRRQSLGSGYSSSEREEPIVAVITRAREHLKSALSGPTLTKAAVRRKRSAVNKIQALLTEEESRLRKGEEPSNANVVDVVLCDIADQSATGGGSNKSHRNKIDEDAKQRPLSAYQQQRHGSISNPVGGNQVSAQNGDRPVLRREKTFDLDPGTSSKDIRVIEIGLEDVAVSNASQGKSTNKTTENKTLSKAQIRTLKAFQEQRANFAMRLQSEVDKLEGIERELSQKSLNAGQRKVKCWEAKQENSPVRQQQPRLKQPLNVNAFSPKDKKPKNVLQRAEKSNVLDAPLEPFTMNGLEDSNDVVTKNQVSDFPTPPLKAEAAHEAIVVPPKPRPRTMIPTPRRPARKCDSFDTTELPRGSPATTIAENRQTAAIPVPLQGGPTEYYTRMTSLACSSRPPSAAQRMSGSLRLNIVERRSTSSLNDEDQERPDTAGSTGSCSWFIPSAGEQIESKFPSSGSPEMESALNMSGSGSALLEKYKENKKPKPRAFFITCDEVEVPIVPESRRKPTPKPKVQLKVYELDKNGENQAIVDGGDLQEALRKKRPDYIERTKIRENDRLARKIVSTRGRSVYDPSSTTSKKSSILIRPKNEERSSVNNRGVDGSSKSTPKTRLPTSQYSKAAPKRASTIPTPTKNVAKSMVSPYAAGGQSVGLRGRRPLGVPRSSGYGSAASAKMKKDLELGKKNKSVAGSRSIIS